MSYNGWSNYETWNVSLWLNNEEGSYRELCRIQRRADDKEELAENIEAFCREIWPDGKTPDDADLKEADFEEIAESEWDDDDHPPKTFDEAAERYGIKLSCSRISERPDKLSEWAKDARHFRCRIACGKRSFGLYFSQGSAHTSNPAISDVLGCIIADVQGYDNASDFEDWCSEYGYDADSRKAERIYREVKKQSEQLKRTIGDKAYEAIKDVQE